MKLILLVSSAISRCDRLGWDYAPSGQPSTLLFPSLGLLNWLEVCDGLGKAFLKPWVSLFVKVARFFNTVLQYALGFWDESEF